MRRARTFYWLTNRRLQDETFFWQWKVIGRSKSLLRGSELLIVHDDWIVTKQTKTKKPDPRIKQHTVQNRELMQATDDEMAFEVSSSLWLERSLNCHWWRCFSFPASGCRPSLVNGSVPPRFCVHLRTLTSVSHSRRSEIHTDEGWGTNTNNLRFTACLMTSEGTRAKQKHRTNVKAWLHHCVYMVRVYRYVKWNDDVPLPMLLTTC